MTNGENTERYYAEMEAARNKAEDAYFEARPGRDSDFNRLLFSAGFERAFEMMWAATLAVEEVSADEPNAPITGESPNR